jgi:hypothetical protein
VSIFTDEVSSLRATLAGSSSSGFRMWGLFKWIPFTARLVSMVCHRWPLDCSWHTSIHTWTVRSMAWHSEMSAFWVQNLSTQLALVLKGQGPCDHHEHVVLWDLTAIKRNLPGMLIVSHDNTHLHFVLHHPHTAFSYRCVTAILQLPQQHAKVLESGWTKIPQPWWCSDTSSTPGSSL